MNTTTAYTPLESLLLFQSLLAHGIEAAAFLQISNTLKDNALVKEGSTYDAGRLSPESLQQLFLQLLREELKTESDGADKPDGGLSPNSRKRKLSASPLPTLREAREHIEKLPLLVERLYARYRAHAIKQIREDESRFEALQEEIKEIERGEWDGRIRQEEEQPAGEAAGKDGTPGPEEPKDVGVPNGTRPSPPLAHLENEPSPVRQASPEKAPPAPVPPSQPLVQPHVARPQQFGQVSAAGSPFKTQEPTKPQNGAQVLQAPQGVQNFSPRPVHPGIPQAQEVLQRPEAAVRAKPPVLQPAQPQVPGTLKWEPPYQPHPSPTPPRQQPNAPHYPPQRPLGPPQVQQGQVPPQQWNHPAPSHPSPRPLQPQQSLPGSQPAPQHASPVLVPPQHAGHPPPPLHPAPMRPSGEPAGIQPQPRPASAEPPPNQARIAPPQFQQPYPGFPHAPQGQGRPPVSVTPTPPPLAPSPAPAPPPQRQPSTTAGLPQPSAHAAVSPAAPSPASAQAEAPKQYSSPYHPPPRPAIMESVSQAAVSTPTAPVRAFRIELPPVTPLHIAPSFDVHGSGTKWKSGQPTPSTPRPDAGDLASPAYEVLSPVLQSAQLPVPSRQSTPRKSTPQQVQKIDTTVAKPRGRPPRSAQRGRDASGTPAAPAHHLRSSHTADPTAEELHHAVDELVSAKIKNEEDTPRPPEETGDTTADESITGRRPPSRLQKRKRRATSPTPLETPLETPLDSQAPPTPPNQVLWTRGFNKVAKPILDQIKSHRFANIFANPVREKVAPGYSSIVLRPQDLKSIHNAVSHGSKAATAIAQALPGGDPGTSTVWLPISEELLPPLGIVNSAQLERELVHMFSNAIMYNPDPNRGPGPAFLAPTGEDEETGADGAAADSSAVLGYKVDENGVVNETRSMFLEVQQLLSNLRSAEVHSGGPPGQESGAPPTGTSTRHASVVGGTGDAAAPRDEATAMDDDGDEHNNTEAEAASVSGTVKRRRITRGL